ncbi:LATE EMBRYOGENESIS ABUNDANT PROTEIN GROUP 2 [Salix viminalis]|uniref:LATE EMBRYOGENESIS ABUNDANT PROTEIN GROUP 2 n=1 Tax=Salix viminalis TaxID=40686 RepID=A0A6N2N547_SALVM|nr:LATE EMBRYOGENESIS ABUNDANT PROTEIN GROUP 2 [Salix viminalis]
MLSAKSESDIASLAPSSPSRSPKRPVYYVQSPSRDSHDGDKLSSMQPSPMESPSHPSSGRHSRNSSGSRFSGIFRSSSGRKSSGRKGNGNKEWNDKGWPECNVIMEEGSYDDEDKTFTRRFQALIALLSFVFLFAVFCLIIWGASRPYKAEIMVKSLVVNNFYVGEGSDSSGVPTKMLTLNGSLRMSVYNPATIFGIHVSSTPINLVYSEIPIATGQLKKYYQPRKSHRTVSMIIEGNKVPLYGAGSSLTFAQTGIVIPLTLKFEIRSRGNVVGKLVRTKHRRQISCPLVIDSSSSKPIKFKKNTCTYD